ncbi:hypothetical protein GCM10023322_14130 [Rugosimonospora acidiphila]|uniref:Uncharacterized protein n=1 Tax=Rugosimonospora acidiphila TaxID=556531 RepID=A0ABP9RNV5_9ACTN
MFSAHGRTDLYRAGYAKIADKIRETEQFNDPGQWRFDWEQPYPRDQWLDLLPTTGGLTQLRSDRLAGILGAVGRAIDAQLPPRRGRRRPSAWSGWRSGAPTRRGEGWVIASSTSLTGTAAPRASDRRPSTPRRRA